MEKINDIKQLNTRCFQIVTDDLELKIRSGKCIEQNWHCNEYPGSWTYRTDESVIEIRITDKTGFTMEAMVVS